MILRWTRSDRHHTIGPVAEPHAGGLRPGDRRSSGATEVAPLSADSPEREAPCRSLRARGLGVVFGGTVALAGVGFELLPGEIQALCGQNGAGKSTLIRCLGGALEPSDGAILVDGQALLPTVPAAERAGIAVIHQEALDFPDLEIAEALYLGREPRSLGGLALDRRKMRQGAARALQALGRDLDPKTLLADLSAADRQLVAIARALARSSRYLILDEPTASLSAREATALHGLIRTLAATGVGVLLVTHRLDEVFQLASRVAVLVDGRMTGVHPIESLSRDRLCLEMVGRKVPRDTAHAARPSLPTASPFLVVDDLVLEPGLPPLSLTIAAGEVVGLFGLVGAGRTELALTLFGSRRAVSGRVRLGGAVLRPGDVGAALRSGIAYVSEDRRGAGLCLSLSVAANLKLVGGVATDVVPAAAIRSFGIKARDEEQEVGALSGGNQQKVLLAKWLALAPRLLILDEPTRGVDVGAKAEIHAIVRSAASRGAAILLISSEVEEICELADRVLVMRQGALVGEVSPLAPPHEIVDLAMHQGHAPRLPA